MRQHGKEKNKKRAKQFFKLLPLDCDRVSFVPSVTVIEETDIEVLLLVRDRVPIVRGIFETKSRTVQNYPFQG